MSLTDRALMLLERVDAMADRLPVVVIARKTCCERERNAFELGVLAGQYGLRLPEPASKTRSRGHLRVV
jgi:hypothetical protein